MLIKIYCYRERYFFELSHLIILWISAVIFITKNYKLISYTDKEIIFFKLNNFSFYLNNIKHFAFFWIGGDISIPSYLVRSILQTYSNDVNIIFLTDKKTPNINGVTNTIRSNLSKDIMIVASTHKI